MNCDSTSANLLQWMVHGSGTYQACGQTIGRLPAGAYTPTSDCYGNIRFQCRDLRVDDLTDFPGSLASQILGEIEHFWEIGERFHSRLAVQILRERLGGNPQSLYFVHLVLVFFSCALEKVDGRLNCFQIACAVEINAGGDRANAELVRGRGSRSVSERRRTSRKGDQG